MAVRRVEKIMTQMLVMFAVFVIVVIVLWWLLQKLPLPEPAGTIIQIAIVVIVAVVVIGYLLNAGGSFKLPAMR